MGFLVDVIAEPLSSVDCMKHDCEGLPGCILHYCYDVYHLQCLREILHQKGKTIGLQNMQININVYFIDDSQLRDKKVARHRVPDVFFPCS